MKKYRSITRRQILKLYAVVCTVLVAGAAAAVVWNSRSGSKQETELPVISAFESNATTLTYTRSDETLTLNTTGDAWTMNGDSEIPVNDTLAATVSNTVSHLSAVRSLADEGISLSDYGLEGGGSFSLTASNLAGETVTLVFGDSTPTEEARYVLAGDTVYTVEASLAETVDCDFYDYLAYDEMPDILPSDLVSLTITRKDVRLELGYQAEGVRTAYEEGFYWYIGYPYEEPHEADELNAHSLFYDVTGLYFYECAAFRPDDLSVYGFDTPLCTADIVWRDEHGEEQTTTLIFGNEAEDGYIYVRFEGSDMVLLANASIANQIAYSAAADLLPRQVAAIHLETVTSLTVSTSEGERTFSGEQLQGEAFAKFYEALTALESSARSPEITPDTPVLTVKFSRNTDHDAEMTLIYYAYDEAYYLANFDGRRDQLVEAYMLESVLELYQAIE